MAKATSGKFAGIAFVVAGIAFMATQNVGLGAAFVAIGAGMMATLGRGADSGGDDNAG